MSDVPNDASSDAEPSADATQDDASKDDANYEEAQQQVTLILGKIAQGEDRAWSELMPVVYDSLHRIARNSLGRLKPGETIQSTDLVNEAYLKLVSNNAPSFENRAHFYAAAARSMRNILVDEARRKGRYKRGGDMKRVSLHDGDAVVAAKSLDLLALDDALEELETSDKKSYDVVMLRYFAGLSIDEVAETLEVSPSSVDRLWSFARAWLHRRIEKGGKTRH